MNPTSTPINSAVQELIDSIPAAPPATEKDLDKEPGEFAFKDGKDNNGMPHECARYVDKNCKRCNGRGYQTFLVKDGYIKEDGSRVARKARDLRTCACVHKGYTKLRNAFEDRVREEVKFIEAGYKGTTEELAEFLKQIRERVVKETLVAFRFADQQTILDVQNGR